MEKSKKRRSIREKKEARFGFTMALPAILLLTALFVFPIMYSLGASFTNLRLTGGSGTSFVGLKNYINTLTDSNFANALINTLKIAVGALACQIIFGTIMATFTLYIKRGRGFFKTLFLIPMLMAPMVTGLLFKFILNEDFGVLNALLKSFGIISKNIKWLTSADMAIPSIVAVETWGASSFVFLMVFTALSTISDEMTDSAKVDGASALQIFFKIQLPCIKGTFIVTALIRFMDLFRIFDSLYVLTGGGPGKASETLAMLVYRTNWTKYQVGASAAISYIMMIIMAAIALILQRVGRKGD